MTAETFIKAQLAAFAWREGGSYGGYNNMLCTAFIIRNRVNAGWHGGDWLKVMDDHDRVRGDEDGLALPGPPAPDIRDGNFRTLLTRIDDVFNGSAEDTMTRCAEDKPALYWLDITARVTPWFKEHILGKPDEHRRIGNVGTVCLFR